MILIDKESFICLILALIVLLGWYIYTCILFYKGKLPKQTIKKFKKICKWEYRNPIDQQKLIIDEYINKYTKEHKIDWEEHL